MFMLVNKRPHIPFANAVEMWILKEKKCSFLKVGLQNPILDQLKQNTEQCNLNFIFFFLIRHSNTTKIFIYKFFFNAIHFCFLFYMNEGNSDNSCRAYFFVSSI